MAVTKKPTGKRLAKPKRKPDRAKPARRRPAARTRLAPDYYESEENYIDIPCVIENIAMFLLAAACVSEDLTVAVIAAAGYAVIDAIARLLFFDICPAEISSAENALRFLSFLPVSIYILYQIGVN